MSLEERVAELERLVGVKEKLSTLVVYVQDETGSMGIIQDQTISAFNEYFDTLKDAHNSADVKVHAWQFSDTNYHLGLDTGPGEPRVRELYKGNLAGVPKLSSDNYRPRGNTPLLDAVGTALEVAENVKVDRYLFIVQTDGLENCSKEYTREQIAKLVEEKENSDNWTILFLGAGIRNWAKEASGYGVAASSTTSYAPNQTRSAHVSAASASVGYLSGTTLKDADMGTKVQAGIDKEEKSD
jgi:hypothetical protein